MVSLIELFIFAKHILITRVCKLKYLVPWSPVAYILRIVPKRLVKCTALKHTVYNISIIYFFANKKKHV